MATDTQKPRIDHGDWENQYTHVTRMMVQTRGDEARTILESQMTCGCGSNFVATQEYPGAITAAEVQIHFASINTALQRQFFTHGSDSHSGPRGPENNAESE